MGSSGRICPSPERGFAIRHTNRRGLSRLDRAILIGHAGVAAVVGIVSFLGANDPEFGSLQRFLVIMLTGLWAGGILVSAVLAPLVSNRWARRALLLGGPFVAIIVIVGATMR